MQQKVFQELDEIILSFSTFDGPGVFSCSLCNYSTAVKSNLGRHIEANHLAAYDIRIPCIFEGCTYHTSTRNAIRKHVNIKHLNRK